MNPKIEGTLSLEGLIEGPLPPFRDAQEKLESWSRNSKIPFSLQIDAGHFSAMPSHEPLQTAPLGPDATLAVADALAELLSLFPPPDRSRIFSTIRSVEIRPNAEVQTLYAIGPDGRIATRQQSVEAKTITPEKPLEPKELLSRAATGLLVAAAIIGISALFIDYPALWRKFTATVEPASAAVDAGPFAPYLTLQITGLDKKNNALNIRFTRLPAFPTEESQFDPLRNNPPEIPIPPASAPASAPATTAAASQSQPATAPIAMSLLRRQLAVESLAKGYLHLQLFDAKHRPMGMVEIYIDPLRSVDQLQTQIPAPMIDGSPVIPASVEILP